MEEIFNRRSIRKYTDQPIEKEKIEKLLRAAMQAPSAWNQQPWEFIVVQDKEKLQKLSTVSPYAKMLVNAPLAIILLGNQERIKYPNYWQQDMGAAAENLLLEAVSLGLGAVWLGIHPVKVRINKLREMFDLKEGIWPYCMVSVGYPGKGQNNKFVDRFDETKVHYETY